MVLVRLSVVTWPNRLADWNPTECGLRFFPSSQSGEVGQTTAALSVHRVGLRGWRPKPHPNFYMNLITRYDPAAESITHKNVCSGKIIRRTAGRSRELR